jgi:hypothetical protein
VEQLTVDSLQLTAGCEKAGKAGKLTRALTKTSILAGRTNRSTNREIGDVASRKQ